MGKDPVGKTGTEKDPIHWEPDPSPSTKIVKSKKTFGTLRREIATSLEPASIL